MDLGKNICPPMSVCQPTATDSSPQRNDCKPHGLYFCLRQTAGWPRIDLVNLQRSGGLAIRMCLLERRRVDPSVGVRIRSATFRYAFGSAECESQIARPRLHDGQKYITKPLTEPKPRAIRDDKPLARKHSLRSSVVSYSIFRKCRLV
jgi:hypothetical protein